MILWVRNSDRTVKMAHPCSMMPGTSAGITQKNRSWKAVRVSVSLFFPSTPCPSRYTTFSTFSLHVVSLGLLTVRKPQGSHTSYMATGGFKKECAHEQKPEDLSSLKMLAQGLPWWHSG